MKKIISSLIFIFLINTLFSQGYRNEYNLGLRQINIDQQQNLFGLTEDEFKNLKGTPYLNEKFLIGTIYKEDKEIQKNILLRYNAYSDEIEIQKSDSNSNTSLNALIKDPSYTVHIINSRFVFIPYKGLIEKGHYFEILTNLVSYNLYKKTTAKFNPPVYAKTSYDKNKPAVFKKSTIYYLVDKNDIFYVLPTSKNKLLKVFSKESKKTKDFVKNNKLNLSNENDLIKLVTYYNTL